MYQVFKHPSPLSKSEELPTEDAEMITFINRVRTQYPDTYGKLLVHIPNEGKRTHTQAQRAKSRGLTQGAADIIIPGLYTFVCEMKRKRGGRVSPEQETYLSVAWQAGAYACLCYGADAAMEAFEQWRGKQ